MGYSLPGVTRAEYRARYALGQEESIDMQSCVVLSIAVGVVGAAACSAPAAVYYQSSSGTLDFVKADFADPMDQANWDIISLSVALTRGDNQGIYNVFTEAQYNEFAPGGTIWYFGATVQDVIDGAITIADFDYWALAHGNAPSSTVGVDGVMYIQAEDIYVDIRFTQWTMGNNGGGFAYTRGIIPAPSASFALLGGMGMFASRRRR